MEIPRQQRTRDFRIAVSSEHLDYVGRKHDTPGIATRSSTEVSWARRGAPTGSSNSSNALMRNPFGSRPGKTAV